MIDRRRKGVGKGPRHCEHWEHSRDGLAWLLPSALLSRAHPDPPV